MIAAQKAAGRETFPSGGFLCLYFLARLLGVKIEIRHMPQAFVIQ